MSDKFDSIDDALNTKCEIVKTEGQQELKMKLQ